MWKGLATGEKPRVCQPLRGLGQGPEPALRPQLLHWLTPKELSTAVIPARVQLLTLESHSVSSHFLLLVLPLFCPQLGLRHRQMLGPSELTFRASQRFQEQSGGGETCVCARGSQ